GGGRGPGVDGGGVPAAAGAGGGADRGCRVPATVTPPPPLGADPLPGGLALPESHAAAGSAMTRRTAIDRTAAVRRRGRWIRIDTTGAYRQRLSQPICGGLGGTRARSGDGLIQPVETG